MRAAVLALSVVVVAPTLSACRRDGGGTVVSFTTKDGIRLAAEEFGSGRRGVVLAHGSDADKRSWRGYARALASAGHHVVVFDFRGYGGSGGERRPAQIDRDVVAAVEYLKQKGSTGVVAVGAAMGGLACLKAAAITTVNGVATLSTPLEYMGLRIDSSLASVFSPKLFLAGEGDPASVAAGEFLLETAPEPRSLLTYNIDAVGVGLLRDLRAAQDLTAFIDNSLG